MKLHIKSVILILSAASLSACATLETTDPMHGQAVRHNIAVQAVAPTPEQKENTYIRPDAQRMSAARERYRKDEVEEPVDFTTTD